VLNSRERPTLDQALARQMKPLTIQEVLALSERSESKGAQVLDTRDPAAFAAAHLAGSINIGLVGQYATWAGTILSRETPIVIVADPGTETESALRLGRIGFDHVTGYLAGGLQAANVAEATIADTERVSAGVTARRLASDAPPLVVDVRTATERAQKHIAGSVHIPLNHLMDRLPEIPRDRHVLVHCAGGYRSSIAASLLQRAGYTRVSELAGGLTAWDDDAERAAVGT
jgi:rhodanese-related sulfurtransferase